MDITKSKAMKMEISMAKTDPLTLMAPHLNIPLTSTDSSFDI